jgi:hypothetical protein
MDLKGLVKQEKFVLTRDMVPIHFSGFERNGASFVCPLPLGFKKVIAANIELITRQAEIIVEDINGKILLQKSPFKNILFGYQGRTEEEQLKFLRSLSITEVKIDEKRGVYSVDVRGGHVSLDQKAIDNCDGITLFPLRELFEANTAFLCHNIDWYWQALLTREFCVRYFNLLNPLIFQKQTST